MNAAVRLPVHRSRARGDCESSPRPCPYVGCRHHLLIVATSTDPRHKGKATWHPALAGRQPEGLTDGELADVLHAMPATCSPDVAEAPRTQEEVAEVLGIVKQGVNAAETRLLRKLVGNTRIVRKLREWL